MSNGNGHRWSKFWWQDWQNDPALKMCCLAAQGLWMRLLCLAHEGTPVGHVTVNGKAPTVRQIAAIVGVAEKEVAKLIGELEEAGVFSRTHDGTIFSRRMVRDVAASERGREWGKAGGNPSLNGKGQPPKNLAGGLTPPINPSPYPPPLTDPVKPRLNGGPNPQEADTDSEAEAEKESKFKIKPSLSYPCSAREAAEPTPAARLAAQTILGRVARSFESSARQAPGKLTKLTVAEQQLAAMMPAPIEGEILPPDQARPRRSPVDPIRTVSEQLAALGLPLTIEGRPAP